MKPFIVAEVGSNWRSFQDCIDSIVKAKQAGADAVKFQLFSSKELYGFQSEPELTYALPLECIPKLAEKAKACGIEFMCTAFSPDGYKLVDPYVSRHKVASAECTHLRILETVRRLGKPVILSTGAHGEQDIEMALRVLGKQQTTLLYCVADYPASEVNLETIPLLQSRFGVPTGYSDHTTDVAVIPREAARLGATVIEKHFTVIPEADTPDRPHSLTPEQFTRMVRSLRGDLPAVIGPATSEKNMVLRHNRRLIATRDIAEGEAFQEGVNFGIYRSIKSDTHAFHPFAVTEVGGRPAKRSVQAGDGIGPGDV